MRRRKPGRWPLAGTVLALLLVGRRVASAAADGVFALFLLRAGQRDVGSRDRSPKVGLRDRSSLPITH